MGSHIGSYVNYFFTKTYELLLHKISYGKFCLSLCEMGLKNELYLRSEINHAGTNDNNFTGHFLLI